MSAPDTSSEAPPAREPSRVDPSTLDFTILEQNERHASAPKPKKRSYIRERCECKRRGYTCSGRECVNRAMRMECSVSRLGGGGISTCIKRKEKHGEGGIGHTLAPKFNPTPLPASRGAPPPPPATPYSQL